MKRTVKALQDLYVKLGGQLTDTYANIADGIKVGLYKRIPDIIEAVKEKASGGGGAGLPEVTAADNGDVLTVVEGAWAKADAPSGGALVIGINYDEQAEIQSLNKTWQEIYNAMSSGRGAIIVNEVDEMAWIVVNIFVNTEATPPIYALTDSYDTGYQADSADGYPINAL